MLQFSVTTHPRKSNESSPQAALVAIKNNFSAENAQSETGAFQIVRPEVE